MRVLCPDCGAHHEVVRLLEGGEGDSRRDIYETQPLEDCERRWLTDRDILDARAHYGGEAIVADDDDEVV